MPYPVNHGIHCPITQYETRERAKLLPERSQLASARAGFRPPYIMGDIFLRPQWTLPASHKIKTLHPSSHLLGSGPPNN
jgi:hypothetical protein